MNAAFLFVGRPKKRVAMSRVSVGILCVGLGGGPSRGEGLAKDRFWSYIFNRRCFSTRLGVNIKSQHSFCNIFFNAGCKNQIHLLSTTNISISIPIQSRYIQLAESMNSVVANLSAGLRVTTGISFPRRFLDTTETLV